MKRFIFTLFFGLLLFPLLKAQEVKDIVATASNDTIIVTCQLETDFLCTLQLQYSDNKGLTWNNCKTIQGDIANQAGGTKTIYWNCLSDGVIMGNFLFKVVVYPISQPVTVTKKKYELEEKHQQQGQDKMKVEHTKGGFVILPGCSFGNTMSYSLMLGYMGKWGGYAKIKSSFGSKDKNAIKGDVNDAFFNGNSKKGRLSAYAGVIGELHPFIYMYAGIGYGNKWLQWETMDNTPMEIRSGTYSGIDPEVGILFKIKAFTFGGGFNCLVGDGHTNGEGNISVGVIF